MILSFRLGLPVTWLQSIVGAKCVLLIICTTSELQRVMFSFGRLSVVSLPCCTWNSWKEKESSVNCDSVSACVSLLVPLQFPMCPAGSTCWWWPYPSADYRPKSIGKWFRCRRMSCWERPWRWGYCPGSTRPCRLALIRWRAELLATGRHGVCIQTVPRLGLLAEVVGLAISIWMAVGILWSCW